jgi:uncharacterized protein (DUF924 family)
MTAAITPSDILSFWKAAGYERWFEKDSGFDALIRERFSALWQVACEGGLDHWQQSDDGALALTIVLDQFPRNLFRNAQRAYSTDERARGVADQAIARGADMRVDPVLRQFFYLPFMHSEQLADQQRSVALYKALGEPEQLRFAVEHHDIIRAFGRFPHRNPVLGRQTSAAEQAYLDANGFAG